MLASPILGSFDYIRPTSLEEACAFLRQHAGDAWPFMGGTDLFVRMRDRVIRPRYVVDVKGISGMQAMAYDEAEGLIVGAAVNMNTLCRFPAVQEHYPLLIEACHTVGSYQLRTRATLAGNVCNASPAADTVPALLCYEAEVQIAGPDGQRTVPLARFFLGPGSTVLEPGELVTAIRVPPPPPAARAHYIKLARNAVGDLAIVGVAALFFDDESTPAGKGVRIALASVAPTPLRATRAEAVLAAVEHIDEAAIADAGRAAREHDIQPISDVRGSAEYRSAMVEVLTRRALQRLTDVLDR